MESLLELFVHVDDICKAFLPKLEQHLLNSGAVKRHRTRSLSVSEVMTILIHFHQSHYATSRPIIVSMSYRACAASSPAW